MLGFLTKKYNMPWEKIALQLTWHFVCVDGKSGLGFHVFLSYNNLMVCFKSNIIRY